MDTAGNCLQQLTISAPKGYTSQPEISADGSRVVYLTGYG